MKKMTICALMAMALPVATWAQEEESENGVYTELEANVVTNYIWHGQNLGGLSVQPSLTVGWNDLWLNVWGSAGIATDDHREIDFAIGYDLGNLSLAVTDYWFLGAGESAKFMNYAAHSTLHTIEASVGYDFGFCSLLWSTYFAGADYETYTQETVDENGEIAEEEMTNFNKRHYTSYIQIDVPFKLGGFDGMATVGATPWASSTYESDGFMVCEAAVALSKEVKITPTFSVTATGKVAVNPATEDAFFVLGLGF